MSRYLMDYAKDFTGGENSFSSPDNLLHNQLLMAENIELFGRGGFQVRGGIEQFKDLGLSRINRIIEFEYLNDSARVLKRFSLTNGNLVNWDTGTVELSGLDQQLDYEVYDNKLYILSNNLFKVYNGTAWSDVTNTEVDSNLAAIKKCRYIEQRGQRFFACGNPDDPNALYFSEVGDPTYWKTLNIIKAISDDADSLTGLKEYHGALLAFKSRTIYAWFGYDPTTDVVFQELNVHTGTRAFRTICNVGDKLFYFGNDNSVYSLMGTYKDVIVSRKISRNITPRLKATKRSSTQFYLDTASAVFYDGKYMLSVATTELQENNLVCVFYNDLVNMDNTSDDENPADTEKQTESWTVNTGWNISEFLYSLDGELYSGSSKSGKIFKHISSHNDLGQAISINVKPRPLDQGLFVESKKYRYGYLAVRQSETEVNAALNIDCYVDYFKVVNTVTPDESLTWDIEGKNWDTAVWDFSDFTTKYFKIKEKGKRVMLHIYGSILNKTAMVYGYGIEYKPKKAERR